MTKNRQQNEMDFGIRVAAVVERGGSVLLVRHDKPGREPYWVLPGGRLEPGETIPECAVRELAEEARLNIEFQGVLYVSEFLREGRHTVDITVRATADPDEEPALGEDPEVQEGSAPTLKELRWVRVEELEEIDLLPERVRRRIAADTVEGWPGRQIYLGGDRH